MMKPGIACIVLFAFFQVSAFAEEAMTAAEIERWFYEDEDDHPVQVEEGELVFLTEAQNKPLLHSINEITISEDSVDDGWVKLVQCYENLDPVANTTIVYNYRFMRNLKIVSSANIDAARVNDQQVELLGVMRNAGICVSADIRVLYRNEDGSYSLINGPYHRKFLDGYFPYHVTLIIHYPGDKLEHIASRPVEQKGFRVEKQSDKLRIDTVFSGMLNTEIIFNEVSRAR